MYENQDVLQTLVEDHDSLFRVIEDLEHEKAEVTEISEEGWDRLFAETDRRIRL
jgi:hypothetical protein